MLTQSNVIDCSGVQVAAPRRQAILGIGNDRRHHRGPERRRQRHQPRVTRRQAIRHQFRNGQRDRERFPKEAGLPKKMGLSRAPRVRRGQNLPGTWDS